MRKYLTLLLLFVTFQSQSQNLQFQSNLSYNGASLANIWGYVDSLGNEYALVGTDFGLSIVDVTVPSNPVIRFTVPGASSNWREVKTYQRFAYVTTEGGGGLTVVDLSQLPASVNSWQYTGDGAIAGQLETIHALHCDTTRGFLYLYGSNIGDGHTLFLDLSDPWNPTFAGEYIFPGGGGDAYVHDGYADNDTLYEGHIYGGFFAIVDVRNKSNPVLLGTQVTPTAFTHNTWLSVDHKTLFTTDENSSSFLGAYDVSDPANIQELSRFQHAPGSNAIVHNTHIINDFSVTSWYKEGVVITDVSRPANPVEVGHYDTYTQGSGNGFNGCWGVYPFLPSGTIVASDIDNGLYVLSPTYIRGCYLEGVVTDSVTGIVLPGSTVLLVQQSISKSTSSTGEYKMGTTAAGVYDLLVSKPGYVSKTINGITLANGQLTQVDVQLAPVPTISIEGLVVDSITGLPVANAQVQLHNQDFTIAASTDSFGVFTMSGVVDDLYTLTAGKWGYYSSCNVVLASSNPFTILLLQGYQDDFTFDFGWTVSSTTANVWERDEPVGTVNNNGDQIAPEFDVTGDCGEQCYVTDNGGGTFSNHDVDNGYTHLSSPAFDATIYLNPVIEFDRWFINTAGSGVPNDIMEFKLTDGTTTVSIGTVDVSSPGAASWVHFTVPVSSFLTPSTSMRLLVEIEDVSPGHVLEGAIDNFMITGTVTTETDEVEASSGELLLYPNPSAGRVFVRIPSDWKGGAKMMVRDLVGREIYSADIAAGEAVSHFQLDAAAGTYWVTVSNENGAQLNKALLLR